MNDDKSRENRTSSIPRPTVVNDGYGVMCCIVRSTPRSDCMAGEGHRGWTILTSDHHLRYQNEDRSLPGVVERPLHAVQDVRCSGGYTLLNLIT
jgi:hypothetical protein